jgi:hypothetical protein
MTGQVKFRKKLRREQFRAFMAQQPACLQQRQLLGTGDERYAAAAPH